MALVSDARWETDYQPQDGIESRYHTERGWRRETAPPSWSLISGISSPQTAPESGSELTSGTHSPYTRVQFSETISERNKGGSILKRFDEPLYEAELRAYWLVNQPYTPIDLPLTSPRTQSDPSVTYIR